MIPRTRPGPFASVEEIIAKLKDKLNEDRKMATAALAPAVALAPAAPFAGAPTAPPFYSEEDRSMIFFET